MITPIYSPAPGRYERECVKIHLMISFRHGFRGFHGKKTKKICVFRVIRA